MKKRNQSGGTLYERIARALGWSLIDTHSFSLQSLRELVRPEHPKLAHEIDEHLRAGSHITGRGWNAGRARLINLAYRLKNP